MMVGGQVMVQPSPRAWEKVPVVWLTGVRRVGKRTLAKELPDALFLNCDLPGTARRVADVERFFASVDAPYVVFDEVHQLPDPSRLLKAGADEFSHLKIRSPRPVRRDRMQVAGERLFAQGTGGLSRIAPARRQLRRHAPGGASLRPRLSGRDRGILQPRAVG